MPDEITQGDYDPNVPVPGLPTTSPAFAAVEHDLYAAKENYLASPSNELFNVTQGSGGLRKISVMKQVEIQVKQAEEHLANMKRVQEILTKNPEIHELLTLMRRIGI